MVAGRGPKADRRRTTSDASDGLEYNKKVWSERGSYYSFEREKERGNEPIGHSFITFSEEERK